MSPITRSQRCSRCLGTSRPDRGSESTLTTRASGPPSLAVALGGNEQHQGAQPFVDTGLDDQLGLLPAHEHPPQQALSERRLRLQVEGPASAPAQQGRELRIRAGLGHVATHVLGRKIEGVDAEGDHLVDVPDLERMALHLRVPEQVAKAGRVQQARAAVPQDAVLRHPPEPTQPAPCAPQAGRSTLQQLLHGVWKLPRRASRRRALHSCALSRRRGSCRRRRETAARKPRRDRGTRRVP